MPSQSVARIQRMQFKNGNIGPINTGGYTPGQFYRAAKHTGLTTGTIKVGALVFRGLTVAVAKENMLLEIADRVCTGPDVIVAIEFLIGGRVSVNVSTEVVVETDRSVVDVNVAPGRAGVLTFSRLFKLDAKALKQPLEIQTNGGTMAIKG
jgi:hypothetical protein